MVGYKFQQVVISTYRCTYFYFVSDYSFRYFTGGGDIGIYLVCKDFSQ